MIIIMTTGDAEDASRRLSCDLRCKRCVDMIIMMTAGDAEDDRRLQYHRHHHRSHHHLFLYLYILYYTFQALESIGDVEDASS